MQRLLVFIVLLAAYFPAQAQSWAPDGAVWHFSYLEFWNQGYIKVEKTGDTTINGYTCDILTKTSVLKNLITSHYDTTTIGREFIRADGNKVSIYRFNRFYTLFDFDAIPGDTWEIPATYVVPMCDTTGLVIVSDTFSVLINDTRVRALQLSTPEESHWGFGSTVYEQCGPVDAYLFPELTLNSGIADIHEGGPFRCYSDPVFGTYTSGIAPACDFVVGIETKTINKLAIFPNPAHDYFMAETSTDDAGLSLQMVTSLGQTIKTQTIITRKSVVITKGLKPGLYFVQLVKQDKVLASEKIVIK